MNKMVALIIYLLLKSSFVEPCDRAWVQVGASCYLMPEKGRNQTFEDARNFCAGLKARLPTFHNYSEYTLFNEQIATRNHSWLGNWFDWDKKLMTFVGFPSGKLCLEGGNEFDPKTVTSKHDNCIVAFHSNKHDELIPMHRNCNEYYTFACQKPMYQDDCQETETILKVKRKIQLLTIPIAKPKIPSTAIDPIKPKPLPILFNPEPKIQSKTKTIAKPNIISTTISNPKPKIQSKSKITATPNIISATISTPKPQIQSKTKSIAKPNITSTTMSTLEPKFQSTTISISKPKFQTIARTGEVKSTRPSIGKNLDEEKDSWFKRQQAMLYSIIVICVIGFAVVILVIVVMMRRKSKTNKANSSIIVTRFSKSSFPTKTVTCQSEASTMKSQPKSLMNTQKVSMPQSVLETQQNSQQKSSQKSQQQSILKLLQKTKLKSHSYQDIVAKKSTKNRKKKFLKSNRFQRKIIDKSHLAMQRSRKASIAKTWRSEKEEDTYYETVN